MPATAGCMVVRIVDQERDAGVVGEGPLDLVGVPLVQTELALSVPCRGGGSCCTCHPHSP